MIGNDIISIDRWKKHFSVKTELKIRRLFTPSERKQINRSEDILITSAVFWSMKEAVYKSINRETGVRIYAPLSFSCQLSNDGTSGSVTHNGQHYACSINITDQYIHSTTQNPSARAFVHEADPAYSNQHHEKSQELLKQEIANQYNLSVPRIQLLKEGSLPYFMVGQDTKHPLSISHDGQFYACYYPVI